MSTIQIKRGNKQDLPNTALPGEPLVTLDTKELFIGNSSNNVSPIKTESNNIIDKDEPNGVAKLDNDKNIPYNISTENLLITSAQEVTINYNEHKNITVLHITEYRLAKYLVNVTDTQTGGFYSAEIIAHHDGINAEFSIYGIIGNETVIFEVVVESSNMILKGISSKNNQIVRVITTAIRI